MKKILYPITLTIFITVVGGCGTKNKPVKTLDEKETSFVNPYLKKYSGGYTIEVKGITSNEAIEAYALNENGNAKWMWIENDGSGGAKVQSSKTGTWTANDGSLSVMIEGNSGTIIEDYQLKNGVFYDRNIPDRYLKKSKSN